MKQVKAVVIALIVGGLFAPLLLACSEDKANAPPPATGTPTATDDAGAAAAAPARHTGGW